MRFGLLSILTGLALTIPGCERIQGGVSYDGGPLDAWGGLGPGLVAGGLYWMWASRPRKARR